MPKYKVESNIKNNGKTYEAGDIIELDESIAGSLLKDGIISAIQGEAKKEDDGTGGDNSNEKAEDGQEDKNSGKEADEEAGDDKEGNKDGEGDQNDKQDSEKEYSEMETGELIATLKAREIVYEGNDREEMINLLEISESARKEKQEENQGEEKKDDEDNGNDL